MGTKMTEQPLSSKLNRRDFIGSAALSLTSCLSAKSGTGKSFFTLQKKNEKWLLKSPEGKDFFTIGLNHIDPASLRYPENLHLWKEKYGGSTIRWIKESVAPNLKKWGFNSVGWVQEVTVKQWRHSRPFTVDEYRALDMPYCHLLPFTESHQWEKHTVHYDYFSKEWVEWCDYVARSHCAELSEEQNLIGYFYSDCPGWVHDRPYNKWKGPVFDPEKLKSEAGKRELRALSSQYYKTTHDAVKRYDKNHLILGDRYEANSPIPDELVSSALPYIDVLSFQDFKDPLRQLPEWHRKTKKPVLLADAAGVNWQSKEFFRANNGEWYARVIDSLYKSPGCIGFHLCGAYQRNKARRRGLLDEMENPDSKEVNQMKAANLKITKELGL